MKLASLQMMNYDSQRNLYSFGSILTLDPDSNVNQACQVGQETTPVLLVCHYGLSGLAMAMAVVVVSRRVIKKIIQI